MKSAFRFYARLVFAWMFVLIFALMFMSPITRRGESFVVLAWVLLMIFVIASAIAHVRRVRVVGGGADGSTYANRQHPQIEMPMEAGRAFDLLDSTIRELPNIEQVESVRDSLQIRAKLRRGHADGSAKELAVAKLRLLHAQVEPHFLYNTLGSAKYLVKSDPDGAERIIDNLILYLRHSLPRLDNSLTTLGDELDRVRAYLEIMQIRMRASPEGHQRDDCPRHGAGRGAGARQVGRARRIDLGTPATLRR